MCSKSAIIGGNKISFVEKGQGQTIVLLHGYLETKEVWNDFAHELSRQFRVVCVDIPGHGNSNVVADIHTMDLMADCINSLLDELKIEKYYLIGHSMGGYVSLAMANKFANKLNGLVLFHSSVYADNDEKKKNRNREIQFIKDGKKDLIINVNLPNMFANENTEAFKDHILQIQGKAKLINEEGICALLRGMMARRDQQMFISQFDKPLLFIFGEKDNYIPVEAGKKMLEINSNIQVEWFENSGHMGFVEEKEKAIKVITDFALQSE